MRIVENLFELLICVLEFVTLALIVLFSSVFAILFSFVTDNDNDVA